MIKALPPSEPAVGIDVGITSLVTLSTGKVANPRHERRDRARLAQARIADRRRDVLHKLSTRIIRENQTVIIEDLPVRTMVRNHSLAGAIPDAGWAQPRAMLEYKADWYGRVVIVIDRFYPSSKTCSACGAITASLSLDVREWMCRCGAVHDRDLNAAKVILAAGLAVSARGDGVRPPRA